MNLKSQLVGHHIYFLFDCMFGCYIFDLNVLILNSNIKVILMKILSEIDCKSNNDCSSQSVCTNLICVDPCAVQNSCNIDETCIVENHTIICSKKCDCVADKDCKNGMQCDGCNCLQCNYFNSQFIE